MKHGERTKIRILSAGCELWRKGSEKVIASEIAAHLNLTHPAILYHFPKNLRDAVAEYAVKIADSHVIVQLIAIGHPAVANMSERQKNVHISAVKNPKVPQGS